MRDPRKGEKALINYAFFRCASIGLATCIVIGIFGIISIPFWFVVYEAYIIVVSIFHFILCFSVYTFAKAITKARTRSAWALRFNMLAFAFLVLGDGLHLVSISHGINDNEIEHPTVFAFFVMFNLLGRTLLGAAPMLNLTQNSFQPASDTWWRGQ